MRNTVTDSSDIEDGSREISQPTAIASDGTRVADTVAGERGNAESHHYKNDAFISYNQEADSQLAKALRKGLQRYGKPFYRLQQLRVFRDSTGLEAGAPLWSRIQEAMDQSKCLILMASPGAAKGDWTLREVEHWKKSDPRKKLLIVWTSGSLQWDDSIRDFDWERTDCLPEALSNWFDDVPLWVDMKWAVGAKEDQLTTRNPHFAESVVKLSAAIQDKTPAQITKEELQEHRRTKFAISSAVTLITIMAVLATWQFLVASKEREEAIRRSFVSLAQALAAQAPQEQEGDKLDERAALLARQAFLFHERHNGNVGSQIDASLRQVLSAREFSLQYGGIGGGLNAIAPREEGWVLAGASSNQAYRVHRWNRAGVEEILSRVPPDALGAVAVDNSGSYSAFGMGNRVLIHRLDGGGGEPDRLETGSRVRSLAFNSEGSRLAVGGEGGKVEVWQLEPRELLFSGTGPKFSPTVSVAFAPDNSAIAWATASGNLQLARPSGEREVIILQEEGLWIESIAFHPDGRRLATAERPGTHVKKGFQLRVWNLQDADIAPLALSGLPEWPVRLCFDAEGTRLACGTINGKICIWDRLDSGIAPRVVRGHRGTVDVAFDTSGDWLASVDIYGDARIWRISPFLGVPRTIGRREGSVGGIELGNGGETVLSHARYKEIALHDLQGRSESVPLPGSEGDVLDAVFQSKGQIVAAAYGHSSGNGVKLWDLSRIEAPPWSPPTKIDWSDCVQFSPDDRWLFWGTDQFVRAWEIDSPATRILEFPGHEGRVRQIELTDDGSRLISADSSGTIRVWSLRDRKSHELAFLSPPIKQMRLEPDDRRIAVAHGTSLTVLDLADKSQLWSQRLDSEINCLAWNVNRDQLAVGLSSGWMRIFDLTKGAQEDPSQVASADLEAGVNSLEWHPDRPALLCGLADGRILLHVPSTRSLAEEVCHIVSRNLTREEWCRFVGEDIPYERTCPNLPAGR